MRRRVSTLAMLIVIAGLGLVAYALLGENSPLQKAVETVTKEEEAPPTATRDTTMKLTVPRIEVEDLNVYDAPWDDESALEVGALHVQDTGFPNFPWEEEPNVYIAGHRLGYFGTASYLVFYDLDKMEEGDEVFLTDSEGTRYTYRVFKNVITGPYDWSVTEPIPGKNIVTLQTCTLPDYADRIVVQAELVKVEQDEPEQKAEPVEAAPIEPAPVEPAPVG